MLQGYRIITLCISNIGDERHFDFIKELSNAILPGNWRIIVYHTSTNLNQCTRNESGEKSVFELINYDITDAVIIFDESLSDKELIDGIIRSSIARNIPVISVGAFKSDCISVCFDYEKGFEEVVRHVIGYHGARDVFFVAGRKDEPFSDARLSVYKQILAEYNIPFNENNLGYGDFWFGPVIEIANSILQRDTLPEAVICFNDFTAITVCSVFQEHNVKVPEDVIVTGFDGTQEAKVSTPSITTSECNYTQLAQCLYSILDECFQTGDCAIKYHSIPYTIYKSTSCGCKSDLSELNYSNIVRSASDSLFKYKSDARHLYDISEKMLLSVNKNTLPEILSNLWYDDICILLNKVCMDERINPEEYKNIINFDDEMLLVHKWGTDPATLPLIYSNDNINELFISMFETGNPVIINSLCYMGIPMGYMCFYMPISRESYNSITQIIPSIDNSIGSYRSLRYLRYTAGTIEQMSRIDYLTGINNRKGFYYQLEKLTAELDSDRSTYFYVFSVDLDGLKYINDTFGHDNGDFAIKTVANAIRSLPYANSIYARFGGDEFTIFIISEEKEIDSQVRKYIKSHLDTVNKSSRMPYEISASIGVYISDYLSFNFETMLQQADENMYEEKRKKPHHRR